MPAPTFSSRLLAWFDRHGRKDMPWQHDATPYRVWVSEIMLQQTQVATVIPYFERFMQRFPDLETLAGASIDEVLHLWSGLGYYSRARNLHKTAGIVHQQHRGIFPLDIADTVNLPGIGPSTAGAILALSANQRHPILDGNVKRVLARHDAVGGWPGSPAVEKLLWLLAERYTPDKRVAAYTQAIMDLGATVCTRTRPRCVSCPVMDDCAAYRSDATDKFPVKRPRQSTPLRTTTMLILVDEQGSVLLQQRPPAGIWGGLWGFPETDAHDDIASWCDQHMDCKVVATESWPTLTHVFSHFRLDIQPLILRVSRQDQAVMERPGTVWYNARQPLRLGLAAPVRSLLDKLEGQKENHVTHC
ncbi:MAG: A/G-specific adenine glycosylase [Gammaproteobacteria bacterium]|nr:MAG: A/G-specific adenine glycosylase [Gammaproteobacteria bacterium]TND02904.1 MAG: A/G-specific adenine glycosylase [Gammaproteobacteria bacterium]